MNRAREKPIAKRQDDLKDRLKVAVIGLGRVGLPFGLVAASAGNLVFGLDCNQQMIERLKQGKLPFHEPGLARLLRQTLGKRFHPTACLDEAVQSAEIVVIMVGVGLSADGPDTASLAALCRDLARFIAGKTIIIRTTVPIGTTEHIRDSLESATGLAEGKDFWLAYIPERVVEGRVVKECCSLPVPIGAFSNAGFRHSRRLFDTLGNRVIRLDNPKQAEMIKLVDNAYRNTIFAFSNEVALMAEQCGVDGIRVIEAANESYPRNRLAYPSYGVSGYCLSKDPLFFEEAFKDISRERGFRSLSHSARQSNNYLIDRIYRCVATYAEKAKTGDGTVRVLVAGLSFKEDVDDFRMSHGLDLVRRLCADDRLAVTVFDPYLGNGTDEAYCSVPKDIKDKVAVSNGLIEAFQDKDVAIFTVKHRLFTELRKGNKIHSLLSLMRSPALVIDGWNIFPQLYRHSASNNGFRYVAPGRIG